VQSLARFAALRPRRRWLILTFLISAGTVARAFAQPGADDTPSSIRPTVVPENGDAGGKFFGRPPAPEKTRHYYVAAEPEIWDFAPAGRDEICGLPFPPGVARNRKSGKIRYVQYTDATFTAKVIPNPTLGILGPALRGVVGEFLVVTFLNRTAQPLSMHAHGVKYDKDSEGSYYLPSPGRGGAVGPGAQFTYVWHLEDTSGPLPNEPSSKAWLYHSHVAGDSETNLGLVGFIIVTDPNRARADGTPRDVDREFATLFMVFDESAIDEAAADAAANARLSGSESNVPQRSWTEMQQAREQASRYAINGRIFGNLAGLEMNEGEHTRWYLFGLGSETDLHTAHWHGLRVTEEGRRRTDTIELLPATMKIADLVADNPGTWLYHCHVAEHMQEGMFARLTVHARDTVGIARSPAQCFLGYPASAQSLRIDRAEVWSNLNLAPDAVQLTLEGAVTVDEGFVVFNDPVRLQLGHGVAKFQPDALGIARAPGAIFRIKNMNEYGVVSGGLLYFEITLTDAGWIRNATGLSATTVSLATAGNVALVLEVGHTRHTATASIVRRMPAKN
jgi:hypothetical protein